MITAINEPGGIAAGREPGACPVAISQWAVISLGIALSASGLVMAVLAMVTAPPQLQQLVEIALGLAVAIPGLLITRAAVAHRGALPVGVLLPEIVLAAAMVYLATVLSLFHTGQIGYPGAVSQFLTALAALGSGAAGLILAGVSTASGPQPGRVSFPIAVREGSSSSSAPSW